MDLDRLERLANFANDLCPACYGTGLAAGCGCGRGVKHVADCGTRRPCDVCHGAVGGIRLSKDELLELIKLARYAPIS